MADPELAAVEHALNTLALAETESALQKVISRLLPALLTALSTPSAAARQKIIETLQHINVRLRALSSPRLPFHPVLSAAVSPNAALLTTNVAIQGGYVARCFHTLSESEQANALAALLNAASGMSAQINRDALHALAVFAVAAAVKQFPAATDNPVYALVRNVDEAALQSFFAYSFKALRSKLEKDPPEVHLIALVRLASEYAGVKQPAKAVTVFPMFLMAAGSPGRSALSEAGEEALKRVDSAETLAAEDPEVVRVLFDLFTDRFAELTTKIVVLQKGLLRIPLGASCFPEVLQVMQQSLHTPGIPARLEALGMQFVSFVVKHADETVLEENIAELVEILMKLVRNEREGLAFSDKMRGFGYGGLAEVVQRIPTTLGQFGVTAELLFSGADMGGEIGIAAVQGLIAIARVVRIGKSEGNAILKVMMDAFQGERRGNSIRAASVTWANECFEGGDCRARLVNIVAAADEKQDVRELATAGLVAGIEGVQFTELVQTYEEFAQHNMVQVGSVKAYLGFALSVLKKELGGNELQLYVDKQGTGELGKLAETAGDALWKGSESAGIERAALAVILFAAGVEAERGKIGDRYEGRIADLVELLGKKSATGDVLAAKGIAKVVGIATEKLDEQKLKTVIQELGKGLEPDEMGVASGRYEEDVRVAKILSLGQIIASCYRRAELGWTAMYEEEFSQYVMHISRRVALAVESSDVVRTAACISLADVGVHGALPIPLTARAVTIGSLAGILKLQSSAPKLVEAAADALGKICAGEPRTSFKKVAVEALLEACKLRKEDEIRFTAAESLVRCAAGFDAPPPPVVDENLDMGGKATLADDLAEVLLMKDGAYVVKDIIADDEGNENKYGIKGVVHAAIRVAHDERPNARAGGCVSLFTFLRLLGSVGQDGGKLKFASKADEERLEKKKEELAQLFPDIQQAFTVLLGDRSDFVQQLASCGVALVYEMCPSKQQHDLVSTLVRSLTAGKAKAASTVPGDQGGLLELGGINVKESGKSSGTATYKELCTLAQDMGQPELVYKFMDLAGHAALWNNRRGAALAGSALLGSEVAAEQLRPHAKTLLPRLYVYCYDPTESVRVAMGSVLLAVVKAAGIGTVAEAVSEHFELITQHCMTVMTSRQWRSREAACGALRDALVSRTWEQVGESLAEFWYVTLRALDDIKESVRKAAEGTGRALSELSVHLCNPAQVGEEVAIKAIDVVIRSVLPGFTHSVEEVRMLATKTLTEVIRYGGNSLTSSVPDLVEALLEAATELEPQVLNYAQFHVDAKEELQNARVDAASMSSSPLIDSLERLSGYVDESIIDKLIPKLTRLSRIGVGIPTRAATARFFSTLLRTRPIIVEPYASRLMFAAAAAAGMERNTTLRTNWCTAVGAAARLSSADDVGKLVERIVQFSGSEDALERSLASYLAVGLWRRSPDTARQHGSAMLPIAYMGRYESDENAKGAGANWKEVWAEGAPSTAAGLRLYAKEITEICETRLETSTQYRVKRSAAAALGALAEASNETVDVRYLGRAAKALLTALPGHIWDGKIVALEAIGTIASACSDLAVWQHVDGAATVVTTLLQEASRGKREYRLAAIDSASKLLNKCHDEYDLFAQVHAKLGNLLGLGTGDGSQENSDPSTDVSRMVWETGSDASAVDARNKARKANKVLWVSAITCIEGAFASSKRSEFQAKHMDTLIEVMDPAVQGDWEVRLGALQGLDRVVRRLDGGVLLSTMTSDGKMVSSRIVELAEVGIVDARYAAIRRCGLGILVQLHRRVQDWSQIKACFPAALQAAIFAARDKDADSSVQAEAKKVCSLFELQR